MFIRDGDKVFRTYFINNRGDEQMGSTWSYLDITALGRQEEWEDSPEGYPQTPTVQVVELARQLRRQTPRPTRNGSRCRTPERPRSAQEASDVAAAEASMSEASHRAAAAAGVADWLSSRGRADLRGHGAADAFSAADPLDTLCSTAPRCTLGGMVPMYLLMSAFHAAPWLKLIISRT